nr:hypothetical protein [Tanacetum cinerariifolium]
MLGEAREAGQILDEDQLSFLIDPGVPDGQVVHTIIPNNAAFQTGDLDTYDSDCDGISNAKVVLMANISNYGCNVISEVPHSKTDLNDMENQSVHAMQVFEESPVMDFPDNEINRMFKLDLEPVSLRLLQNREIHLEYLKNTQEQADILQGIVEQAKAKHLLDNALDFT